MKRMFFLFAMIFTFGAIAQVDYDYKEEIKILDEMDQALMDEVDEASGRLTDGEITLEEYTEITKVLEERMEKVSNKKTYLINSRFMGVEASSSDKLVHFRNANNRIAAVVVKDSKGDILFHESVNDLINSVYERDVHEEYKCINSEERTDDMYDDFEESQKDYLKEVLISVGYDSYKELKEEHMNTYCEVEDQSFEDNNIVKCNDFLSATRINLLRIIEEKKKEMGLRIQAIGYKNATDEDFMKYELLNILDMEIYDQVSSIEAICIENKLEDTNEAVFDYFADEVAKGGVTIEYTTLEIPSSSTDKAVQN